MISLFLDTSSKKLVIYLLKDKTIIYEKVLETINDHSSFVVPFIDEALKINKLETKDINKIYVVNGPGSFTGTRIGVTVSKTIAYANNINVIPVSSLKQYIFAYNDYDYYVSIICDKGNKLFYGIYNKDYETIISDRYSTYDNLLEEINKLNGKVLFISDKKIENIDTKNQKLDIIKLIDYYKDKEVNFHLLKPNYLKDVEIVGKI